MKSKKDHDLLKMKKAIVEFMNRNELIKKKHEQDLRRFPRPVREV